MQVFTPVFQEQQLKFLVAPLWLHSLQGEEGCFSLLLDELWAVQGAPARQQWQPRWSDSWGFFPKPQAASRWGAQATLSQGCGPRCKWGFPWACLQKTLSGTQICHFLLEISHSQKEREKNLRFPSSKHLPRNFKCSHPNPPPFS